MSSCNTISSSSGRSSNITLDIATATNNHFPSRLHNMLDSAEEKGYSHIISWCTDSNGTDSDSNGKAFKVHDPASMIPILQTTFRQTKYKSFLRQLQSYGFERISRGDENGTVSHPNFQRGKRELCLQMKRKVSRTESKSMSLSAAMAAAANPIMAANMNSAFGYGYGHGHGHGPNLINYAEMLKRITSSSYHHCPSNESARAQEIVAPMPHNNDNVIPIQARSLFAVPPPIAPPVFIPTVPHPTRIVPSAPMSSSFQCYNGNHYTNQDQDQVQAGQIQSRIQALQQELQKRQQQQQQQQQRQQQGGKICKREGPTTTTSAVVSSTTTSSSFHEQGSLLYSANSNPSLLSSSVTVANNLPTNQHQHHLLSLLTNSSDKAYLSPCCCPENCVEICCTFTTSTSSVTDTDTHGTIADNNNNVNNNNNSSSIRPSSMISSNNKRQRYDDSEHHENHLLSIITTDSNKRQRMTATPTPVSSFVKNNNASSFPSVQRLSSHQQQQQKMMMTNDDYFFQQQDKQQQERSLEHNEKQELDNRNSVTISTMSSLPSLFSLSLLEPRPIRPLNSNDSNNNGNNCNKTTTTGYYDCKEQRDNCLHTMMMTSNNKKQQPMFNIPELTAPLFSLLSSSQNLLKTIDNNLGNNYDSFFLPTNDDLDDIKAITVLDNDDDDIDYEEGIFNIDKGIAEFFNVLDNNQ